MRRLYIYLYRLLFKAFRPNPSREFTPIAQFLTGGAYPTWLIIQAINCLPMNIFPLRVNYDKFLYPHCFLKNSKIQWWFKRWIYRYIWGKMSIQLSNSGIAQSKVGQVQWGIRLSIEPFYFPNPVLKGLLKPRAFLLRNNRKAELINKGSNSEKY